MPHSHSKKVRRREVLTTLGAGLGAAFAGCTSSTSPTTSTSTTSSTTTTSTPGPGPTTCAVTPSETEGPYPDRTGMRNNQAFFRRDITEGRPGLPLPLTLTIVSVANACAPIAGASVEVWQCDAAGRYSEYAQPGYDGTGQTFLRGLQTSDANGQVTFTTIYPGWYAGRATHIHVDIYRSGALVKTTQIAFPEAVSAQVYATGVYASHGQNPTTNTADNVFSDGTANEMATLTGSAASGYMATLTIGI